MRSEDLNAVRAVDVPHGQSSSSDVSQAVPSFVTAWLQLGAQACSS